MAGNDVRVVIVADGKQAQAEMGRVEGSAKKVGSAFSDMGKIAGGIVLSQGITGAAGFLRSAASAAAEDEAATRRLDQALRNAGGAFDENKAKIEARIKAGADLAYGDDAVRDSFQTLLAATGDVDEALRRQALAMDFARGAGIPLEQASKLLGKVTEENVEVFKRMGITIGEGATEAEAFAVIQGKFAGQSETYAKSTAGQFEQSKIKMGELKEQIGTALLPVLAKIGTVLAEEVMPAIQKFADDAGPRLRQFADWWSKEIQPKVQEFVDWVVPKLQELGAYIQVEFAKFQIYWKTDIEPALKNIEAGVTHLVNWIIEHWEQIEPVIMPIVERLMALIETLITTWKLAFGIIIDLLGGDFAGAWNKAKELVRVVVEFWLETIKSFLLQAVAVLEGIKDIGIWAMGQLLEGIQSMAGTVLAYFQDEFLGDLKYAASQMISFMLDVGTNVVMGIWNGIQAKAGWLYQQVTEFAQGIVNKVKETLKVWSPSQVMAEVGRNIVEGLGGGMKDRWPWLLEFVGYGTDQMTDTFFKAFELIGWGTNKMNDDMLRKIGELSYQLGQGSFVGDIKAWGVKAMEAIADALRENGHRPTDEIRVMVANVYAEMMSSLPAMAAAGAAAGAAFTGSLTNILAGASTAPFGTPNPLTTASLSGFQANTSSPNTRYSGTVGGRGYVGMGAEELAVALSKVNITLMVEGQPITAAVVANLNRQMA